MRASWPEGPQRGWIKLVRNSPRKWIKLVRKSTHRWIKLVKISPLWVDQARKNLRIKLVRNDKREEAGPMKKSKFSQEQIRYAIRQMEAGSSPADVGPCLA